MYSIGWLVGFYGISTFVGYLLPNLFLYEKSVLFQTIQFSMSTQINCQKHFYFKGCPCGVMVKVMDCGIVVREFVP